MKSRELDGCVTPAIHHCIHGGEATLTFGHFHFIFGGPGYSPAQCHPMRSVWRALLGPHAPDHRMLIGTMCWIDHRCASGHFPGIFPFFPFPFRRFPLPFPPVFPLQDSVRDRRVSLQPQHDQEGCGRRVNWLAVLLATCPGRPPRPTRLPRCSSNGVHRF